MRSAQTLENCLVASYFPLAYYLAMENKSFRDRALAAQKELGLNKTELSKKSGVPYHTVDKFLKREGATTSAENARALAKALGITVDDDNSYDELRDIYGQLTEETKMSLLKIARAMATE